MFIKSLLSVLVSVALAASLNAQSSTAPVTAPAPGAIRGLVFDARDSTPLLTALVVVRSTKDTARVARAQVLSSGTFNVLALPLGEYTVRVAAIGYAPVVRRVTLTDVEPTVYAGVFGLWRAVIKLDSVEVKGTASTMVIEPDRNTYKAKDIAPGAANASEVLEQTPAVAVDADGKVSLRGNESVVVQVNGRPTPMTGVQLGAYLKSLPANVVDRIEVIPNPSAKYDPEGTAGIINIALKPNIDLGLSGGTLLNVHSNSRYTIAGNLGYQKDALSSAMTFSANNDVRNTPGYNDLTLLDGVRSPLSFSNQDIDERTGNGGQTLTNNVDYKLNKRDVLSNALTLNHRMASDATNTSYEEGLAASSQAAQFARLLRSDVGGVLVDEDIAFKRTFVPRKHELSAELRFNRTRERDLTTLWRETTSSSSVARTDAERDDLLAVNKQATAQLDYTRTIAEHTKLETGYRGTMRWLDRDYDVSQDSLNVGTWAPSPKSNALSFSESVNAVYGVLSQGIGKLELQAGLRGELARRDFALATSAQSFPFRYNSLIPSGVVRYNVDEKTQLKASYSRRIRRPGANELNPFPAFYDLQNVFVGNPNLNPEYTNALEFGLVRSASFGTLQLSPFYRNTTNLIRTVIETGQRVEGRNMTTFTYTNIATSHSWGADVNASLKPGRRLTGFTSLNIAKTVVDGTPQASLSPTGMTWTGRANGSFNVTPSLLLNIAYVYRAEIPVPNGHFYRAQNTNITIRQKLNGDKSSVSVSFIDPLATNTFHILVAGGAVNQETERTLGLRGVFLRYQYSFGKTPKVREVQPEAEQGAGRPGG